MSSRPSSPQRSPTRPHVLPNIAHHPSIHLSSIPTPSLVGSVAGGAHYSGVKMEHHDGHMKRRSSERRSRSSDRRRSSAMDLTDGRKRVLDDLKELFCCRPTKEIFERSWSNEAVFEDPLCHCKGRSECMAQWFGLVKLIAKSETLSARVISSTISPNRLVYSLKQEYTLKLTGSKKAIQSIVVVDLDDDDRIIKLVDQWNGEELATWWGARAFRRLNATLARWFVRIPKDQR